MSKELFSNNSNNIYYLYSKTDCGLTKVDIVIVLDASESIQTENWPKMLKFTTEILSEAEIDEDNVRVGLLTYRHNTTVEFNLNEYHDKKRMFEAIDSVIIL
jgi:hypothetical protein